MLARISVAVMATLLGLALCAPPSAAASAAETNDAKRIFNQRCTACHTYGRGVKVGPDLKGVTDRRQRPWLLKFIRSSQSVIEAGDPIARALFQEFKRQRMPDWSDLSAAQVGAILEWLAAAGPDQKEADERHAELATDADVEKARRLFVGEARLENGGLACNTCHSIRSRGATVVGGTLGPDLTTTYARYQDRALTLFFRRPCFQRLPEPEHAKYLTPKESFALKAYLRRASLSERAGTLLPASIDDARATAR